MGSRRVLSYVFTAKMVGQTIENSTDLGELNKSVKPSFVCLSRKSMWGEKSSFKNGGKKGAFLSRPLGTVESKCSCHLFLSQVHLIA